MLWEDKTELVRSLLVLEAAISDLVKTAYCFLSTDLNSIKHLEGIVDARRPCQFEFGEEVKLQEESPFLVLIFQQASMQTIGPWLNGWRNPLSQPPGSLLVIRSADFEQFLRSTPDLASFIGPKIFDSSSMISDLSPELLENMKVSVQQEALDILRNLPGELPTKSALEQWIRLCGPIAE